MRSRYLNHPILVCLVSLIYVISIFNLGNPLVGLDFLPNFIVYLTVIIIFIYSIMSMIYKKYLNKGLVFPFIIFSLCLLPSVVFSEYFDISFFKYIIFFMSIFSLILISNNIRKYINSDRVFLYISFRNINRLSLFISLIILLLGLGYPSNETGFAGLLNQPQAFGVYLTFAFVIELYGLYTKVSTARWCYITLLSIFIYSIMTESRLSIISIIIITVIYILLFIRLKINHLLIFLLATFLGIATADRLQDKAEYILTKSGRSEASGFEALDNTRGGLARASLENFREKPLFGIGFQVSNGKYGTKEMFVERSETLDLPLKASIEKGVFWSAILEEVGIIGFSGFIVFITSYFISLQKKIRIVILASFFLVGFGEAFYFSLGGVGMLAWIIFFMFYMVRDISELDLMRS